MSVVLPNAQLAVVRHTHPFPRDEHGQPVTPASPPLPGPFRPGFERRRPGVGVDGVQEWTFRLDPEFWPLEEGDRITDGTRVWVLTQADIVELVVPGYPGRSPVDYISAKGNLEPPWTP